MSGVGLVQQMDNRCPLLLWPLVPATHHRWSNVWMIAGRGKTDIQLNFNDGTYVFDRDSGRTAQ